MGNSNLFVFPLLFTLASCVSTILFGPLPKNDEEFNLPPNALKMKNPEIKKYDDDIAAFSTA